MKEITIEISPSGETKVSAKGFKGSSCRDATRELEKALGNVSADNATGELYEQPERIQNRNRS